VETNWPVTSFKLYFEYSKVSLEAVNKPFYGFSQYMCNSVEVVKKNVGPANV
jgi:hypothetical protein